MVFGKQPLFTALTARMDWLGERQRVLAQNVANADTPGYLPRDLKPLSFRSSLKSAAGAPLTLAATEPGHRLGRPPVAQHASQVTRTQDRTLAGNAVDMETELMRVAETSGDYQAMTNLYSRYMGMLKTAIGRPGG